jgi:hypothetical protein
MLGEKLGPTGHALCMQFGSDTTNSDVLLFQRGEVENTGLV